MDIRYQNGTTDTVRLLGVDTPEVYTSVAPEEFDVPDTSEGRQWLSEWGDKASVFAQTEIAGEEVRIVVDEQADRRGSYGRLLVYVYHDGEMLNRQLLSGGYARVYPSTFSERTAFEELEATAKRDDVGVWGFEPSETNSTDAGGSLAVAQINEDAPGNDNDNPNGEYLVFENTGSSRLDIGGWRVCDAADHCYTVPSGFELSAGATVTLYTGSGTDTASELYWGSDSAIWNNGGDTITVTDTSGTVWVTREYS